MIIPPANPHQPHPDTPAPAGPPASTGPEAVSREADELLALREEMTSALTAGPGHTAITASIEEIVTAVMPVVVRLCAQRDGAVRARAHAQRQVAGARDLARRWRTGSGPDAPLAAVASTELDDILDTAADVPPGGPGGRALADDSTWHGSC
jgi:hypothetical protein